MADSTEIHVYCEDPLPPEAAQALSEAFNRLYADLPARPSPKQMEEIEAAFRARHDERTPMSEYTATDRNDDDWPLAIEVRVASNMDREWPIVCEVEGGTSADPDWREQIAQAVWEWAGFHPVQYPARREHPGLDPKAADTTAERQTTAIGTEPVGGMVETKKLLDRDVGASGDQGEANRG